MFDSFVSDHTELARKRRLVRARMLLVAAAVYAVGLTTTIAYSYTEIELLPAPAVPVILMAAPPPPPPPPPPPAAHRHSQVVVHPHANPNVLLQPTDKPIPQQTNSKDVGVDDGVEGGQEGGVVGGVLGGQVGGVLGGVLGGVVGGTLGGVGNGLAADDRPAVQQMQSVSPDAAAAHRLCCDPEEISRPAQAVAAHIFGTTMVTVCVDAYGQITSCTPISRLQFITDKVCSVVQSSWKYRPFTVNNVPTPSCFVMSFQYQEEH